MTPITEETPKTRVPSSGPDKKSHEISPRTAQYYSRVGEWCNIILSPKVFDSLTKSLLKQIDGSGWMTN